MQTAPDQVLLAFVILELPDGRSAWRRTRWLVSGWRAGRQPVCVLPIPLRFFDSSFLPRKPWCVWPRQWTVSILDTSTLRSS